MTWLPLFLLIGGCLATPIQQGSLQIVKYTTGKNGMISQNGGIQQPIMWSGEQPIIMEPASLTYGAVKGGSLLTERDQQRHISMEDEVESREDVSDEEIQPENEPKQDINLRDMSDMRQDDQMRPVQTETALLGSSVLSVKGGPNQVGSIESDQVFPQVVSGQRRLIESQIPQQYALKGRSLRPIVGIPSSIPRQSSVVYQDVQGLPLSIEQYKVSSQGVRRPVVQYNLRPIQQNQQDVTQELLRRPIYQVVRPAVKGVQRDVQYLIQPVIPGSLSNINLAQKQPQSILSSLSQVQQRVQQVAPLVQQVVPMVKHVQEGVSNSKQDLDVQGLVSGVQDMTKSDQMLQKQGVKMPVQHSSHKVIIEENSRHVPVVSGQRVIGYQLIPTEQQISPQISIHSQQGVSNQQLRQQGVQYIIQQIPVSDPQQYYQLMQTIPVQSYGGQQQDDISYLRQPSITGSGIQPIQYSDQILPQLEQPMQTMIVTQPEQTDKQIQSSQGIQGVQQIQHIQTSGDNIVTRGQDLRITPQLVNQRSHIVSQNGVKSVINV